MNIKDILFRLKIFGWYLVTEPFRQSWELLKLLSAFVDKTSNWVYIALGFIVVATLMQKKFEAGLFVLFLLFVTLLWEWERGYFMKRYRQKIKKKIDKRFEEEK
tara:strand:+ start:817 stop:1128 length:312 start_codon:yes stop_codon:yes gene_type:complete